MGGVGEGLEGSWEGLGEVFGGLWTLLGWSWLGLRGSGGILGASSGGLEAIWRAFGMSLEDFGIPQRGTKGAQEQLERKTLIFDKWCSRVGASVVFEGQSVPGGIKNLSKIIPDGVGECMEGQIGGKSGPGVFRMRQSGDLGAGERPGRGQGEGGDPD